MGRGRGQQMEMPVKPVKSQPMLSTGAFHKHMTTVERFHQHQPNTEQMTTMLTAHLLTYGTLPERQREQLRLLLNYMSRSIEERDRRWWKLPACAYEGELHFFDSKDGLRNVPLKKKRRQRLMSSSESGQDQRSP